MAKNDYEARTEKLAEPIAEDAGVRIYDVEYVKEGSDYYLRAYIDKDGGVDINDCENVSRALSAKLDENDFIEDAYILEVSSPGLGRTLKKERHFLNSIGQEVEIKTYKPINGTKEFAGVLKDFEDKKAIVSMDKGDMEFSMDMIASARLTVDF